MKRNKEQTTNSKPNDLSLVENSAVKKFNLDIIDVTIKMIEQLRQELVSNQKIRAQIIGFKVTAVTATIGFILSSGEKIPSSVFLVIAFAAVLFDFLITSYSLSIKRTGYYIREYLEKRILGKHFEWGDDFLQWEDFMSRKEAKQNLAFWGNIGLTILVSFFAILMVIIDYKLYQTPIANIESSQIVMIFVCLVLIVFLIIDTKSFFQPSKFRDSNFRIIDTQNFS